LSFGWYRTVLSLTRDGAADCERPHVGRLYTRVDALLEGLGAEQIDLERKRASCTVPGWSGSRGSSVGLARTGRQAIFIYGCVLLGISYLLAFFSDHLLKKRLLRLKRRFARRAPIANPG
jgi:hypothetical protein